MAKELSFSELDEEQVELLPARTLVTALQLPGQAVGCAGDLNNDGVVDATGEACKEVPWWAPKPPG
ncbi:hypothetical protein ACVGVM_25655 [Pseudonocardia bannensis]|uniref:Uncharacterized protein n=1 Tax=Pseudonocardia bannensis TaxID=630973 RepID=A0A848DNV4_9PSEU|nr:hypothetical protein [Pseudonocardia bannensis]NMH94510.1 hypothetical protein [Pseudonocardia bannensis]